MMIIDEQEGEMSVINEASRESDDASYSMIK